MDHNHVMGLALAEARKAAAMDEVPVGAILLSADGAVLAGACNQTIRRNDPTAHAEMLALREAAEKIGNYRLPGAMLYVTIEPCVMCMGAAVHARVAAVVFGARDPKWGGAGSLYNLADDTRLNHQIAIISGIREAECRSLIQDFFRSKRKSVAC